MIPRTLGLRLSLWYAAVFVGSIVLLVAITYALLASSLAQRDHDIINATLSEYASQYETGGLPALEQAVEFEQQTASRERLFVRVLGPGADALFVSVPPGWGDFAVDQLGGGSGGVAAAPARDRDAVLEVMSARLPDGTVLQVGKSNEIRLALLRQFRVVVAWVSVLAMAVGVLGGIVLTHSTLQPLYDLIRVVQRITRTGRTDERVPGRGVAAGDTVDELVVLFNTMLDRITGLIDAMGASLDNVAHDLRTPMARLRAVAERALESGDPGAQREALADCLEESDRILSMLNALMDISEAETGVLRLTREPVDVSALLRDVMDLYEDVAEGKQVALALDAPEPVVVSGAADRLRQAFANLVDNGIKYTPAGGRVDVTARLDPGGAMAVVTVRDTGPGIEPRDLPRIWDRLYRADPSRAERGLGLGLSLVRAYVAAHGGTAEAESEPGHGATFTVRLPVAAPNLSPM